MSWNWKKIDGTKNIPPFNRTVALYEEKEDGKEYVMIGKLKTIDANGCNWISNSNTADIFGFMFQNQPTDFKPSHWCEIMRPKKEKDEEKKED